MTLRELLRAIYSDLENGHVDAAMIGVGVAMSKLDNSREITEKVTTSQSRGWGVPENKRFIVTNHKARVVLDD